MTLSIDALAYRTFVKNLSDDIKDVHGDDYDSGSMFSYYIHKKYNLQIIDNEPHYENVIDNIYSLQNLNLDQDGIYSFMTENNTEMNYFIINIVGDNLTLFSHYPGQKMLIKKKFNKNEWLNDLKKLYLLNNIVDNKIDLYKKIYGLNKVYFNELNLDKFSFYYTYAKI